MLSVIFFFRSYTNRISANARYFSVEWATNSPACRQAEFELRYRRDTEFRVMQGRQEDRLCRSFAQRLSDPS